ncbi:MAG TPA: MarR family winged helix-turn-helix transcriptional regulator [Nocardioides sp.]|nr:MarR family winged helix-turn-helix transcriptional regulator [Nocardioides sp.]
MNAKDGSDLAREPAGYWTGAAHEAVIAYINVEHRKLGVTQRHWMTLNALARSADGLTRAEVGDELRQYLTPQIGAFETYAAVLDDLVDRGYVEADGQERLRLTESGLAKRADIAARTPAIRGHLHEGIDDADYATTVAVLRRMVANATR